MIQEYAKWLTSKNWRVRDWNWFILSITQAARDVKRQIHINYDAVRPVADEIF